MLPRDLGHPRLRQGGACAGPRPAVARDAFLHRRSHLTVRLRRRPGGERPPRMGAVMRILGPDWDFIATDVTDPELGGNGERRTDLRHTSTGFVHVNGEIVPPPDKLVSENVVPEEDDEGASGESPGGRSASQFARSPFVASFRSNWFKFDICTVHIYYGEEHGEKLRRVAEIREIAEYFGSRAVDALESGTSLILLGDFNVVGPEHETMAAAGVGLQDGRHAREHRLEHRARQVLRPDRVPHPAWGARVHRDPDPGRQAQGRHLRDLPQRIHRGPARRLSAAASATTAPTTRPGTSYATTTSTGARTSSPTTFRCGSSCASTTAPPTSRRM